MSEEEKSTLAFINPKKAYNGVPRDLVWWILNKRNVPRGNIEIIKDMYKGAVTRVRTTCEER